MSLQNSYPFFTNFTDSVGTQLVGMQANGIASTATSYPNGIPGHISLVNNSYQSTIYSTDTATLSGIRSEIYFGQSAPGNENWYTCQFLVNKPDWDNGSTGVCSLMQIHCSDTINATNNFVLTIQNDRLVGILPLSDPPSVSTNYKYVDLGAMTYGGWHTLCIHALWEAADTGFLDVYIDGINRIIPRISLHGTCYTSDTPYLKLGVYDAFHTNTFGTYRSAYYKNCNIWQGTGSGFSQVNGAGTWPQPLPAGLLG